MEKDVSYIQKPKETSGGYIVSDNIDLKKDKVIKDKVGQYKLIKG